MLPRGLLRAFCLMVGTAVCTRQRRRPQTPGTSGYTLVMANDASTLPRTSGGQKSEAEVSVGPGSL